MTQEEILQANLDRVFNERDSARRIRAIRELYTDSAELYEPTGVVRGLDSINRAVSELLEQLPQGYTFTAVRPALALESLARLQWRSGPPGGPVAVTGTDVALFEDGRIRALYVFLDNPEA